MSFSSASLRLCAILLVASAQADEPLAWKWAPGDEARYQVAQTLTVRINAGPAGFVQNAMGQNLELAWRVESVDKEGAATIEQRTVRVVVHNKGQAGQDFAYDSDDEDPPAGMASLVAPMYAATIEHPVRFTLRPNGEVTDFSAPEALREAYERLPGGVATGDLLTGVAERWLPRFPKDFPKEGDAWESVHEFASAPTGKLKFVTTYEYRDPEESEGKTLQAIAIKHRLDSSPEPSEGRPAIEVKESHGDALFDQAAGRLHRLYTEREMVVRTATTEGRVDSNIEQIIVWRALAPGEEITPAADAQTR